MLCVKRFLPTKCFQMARGLQKEESQQANAKKLAAKKKQADKKAGVGVSFSTRLL
jgi:hypothetical protein